MYNLAQYEIKVFREKIIDNVNVVFVILELFKTILGIHQPDYVFILVVPHINIITYYGLYVLMYGPMIADVLFSKWRQPIVTCCCFTAAFLLHKVD